MAETKIRKLHGKVNQERRDCLHAGFKDRFGIEIETNWNIVSGRIVTTRVDEQDFTPEQHAFIGGFTAGYSACMEQIA